MSRASELEKAISSALKSVASRALALDDQVVRAVAKRAAANLAEVETALTPAERQAREAQELLDLYDRFGGDGDRHAAMKAARAFAQDPNDPAELERIAHRVRALARRRKAERLRLAA